MMIRASSPQTVCRYRALAALYLALAACCAWAQDDTGVIRRAAELRESAAPSARSIATLPAQSTVTRLGERQGPWLQVRTPAGATGWVHMFDMGSGDATTSTTGNAATGALRGVTNFFNRGGGAAPGSTVATSTIGIRGLGAEDIANAQPNVDAVILMEALRQTEAQARQFAAQAPLAAATVPPLPVPARAMAPPAARQAP
jgi:Bacterial SH3 domain